MKKIFKYILQKYGKKIIEKNTQLKRVYGIIKYPYYIEKLLYRFTLLRVLANTYFI